VDCPTIDELAPEHRLTGIKGIEKTPVWHALSQRQVVRMYAYQCNSRVKDLNLIVAHLGSGISIGSHAKGRCINVENAIFDGPMGPFRVGTLPAEAVIELCYAGLDKNTVKKIFSAAGGLYSHFGTHDVRQIEPRLADDPAARQVLDTLAAGIASRILARLSDFYPEPVDQIILTGRLCLLIPLLDQILEKLTLVGAEISVFPGSHEAEALRDAALRIYKHMDTPIRWDQATDD
jgi:butyrate kinase